MSYYKMHSKPDGHSVWSQIWLNLKNNNYDQKKLIAYILLVVCDYIINDLCVYNL